MSNDNVRSIAFYLPQYHPTPENDEWWGKGFTEWTNVAKAKPLFRGHYQPHVPADLGFYDLRLAEAREAQAELAREYGIHGFCYYHYWFHGQRLLEQPFNEVLASGKPDFPFCLCWANQNWNRVWHGGSEHVLIEQNYSQEDDLDHIQSLIPAFSDERYIKINGRPLFLVYRTDLLPNPAQTAEIWRTAVVRAGLKNPYLVRVESSQADIDPQSVGFDAAVEFAPDRRKIDYSHKYSGSLHYKLAKVGLLPQVYVKHLVTGYEWVVNRMLRRPEPSYTRYRCVMPNYDNSARRKEGAVIFIGSTPEKYGAWLREIVQYSRRKFTGDERLVFINAWNEWGEGNHLEPDLRWGRAYLDATRRALCQSDTVLESSARGKAGDNEDAWWLKKLYWRTAEYLKQARDLFKVIMRRQVNK